jgi:hypothetical protein
LEELPVTIEAGDRVRTETRHTGEVVILSVERTLAYVRLDDNPQSGILAHCKVDTLTKIVSESK